MNYLKITFYENNDIYLEDKNWVNKNNVNLFVNGEIKTVFDKSFYGSINLKECMQYIAEHYKNAKLVEQGCSLTGWTFQIYEF